MKSGAPAVTGATGTCCVCGTTTYTHSGCAVKPRSYWSRPVPQPPSGSVPWEPPSRPQKVPTGRQTPEYDTTGLSEAGRQSERRSTDHRSRCGADQPGPAVRRGDAAAIHDQCERHLSPGTQSVPCRPLTGPLLNSGSRGVWLTIRAIDKHTMTSPSETTSL